MKTNTLIQHLETQNCKKCKVKCLCDQAGSEECLLQKMAAHAIRDLTESLQRLQKEKADLQHNLMIAEIEREYQRSRVAFFADLACATDKVIYVEGYKAFRGTMKIQPKTEAVPAFELSGDWLYKPETGCWYVQRSSFPEDVCTIVEVGAKKLIEWKSDLICGGFAEEWAYVCPECGCKISDKSGLCLGEYARKNQQLNFCPNCGSITKKGTNV